MHYLYHMVKGKTIWIVDGKIKKELLVWKMKKKVGQVLNPFLKFDVQYIQEISQLHAWRVPAVIYS